MDNIEDIINQVIGRISEKKTGRFNEIEDILKAFIQQTEWQHIKLIGEKDKKVFINVESPAWLHQLQMRKHKILNELNKNKLGLNDIVFKVGKI